jgi:RNA polymerase sigma factor (sigma-70 family)
MRRKQMEISDDELIQIITSEDDRQRNKAFSFLVKRDFPAIRVFISKNSGQEEDAKDIFQDGLITLMNNLNKGSFKGNSTIKSYLFAICKNIWFQHLRKNKNYQQTELPEIEATEEVFEKEEMEEKYNILKKNFKNLGNECQKMLIGFYYQNKSMKDLQQIFNLGSPQAAKNKKSRCLKKLTSLVNG